MYKILDLFCGAGGFSAGLEKNSNFKTLIGVDFDKNAIQTFSHNFPNATAICGDLCDKKTKETIINLSKKLKINMIIGGPPCQGFSLKGKKLGLKDPRNFLFVEYLDLVEKIKPELFIIENVKNLYSSADGYFKDEIEKTIKTLGYTVNSSILNAKYYGVPQNRERVFFMAHKHRFIAFPAKNTKIVTVKDAIFDLAYLNSAQGDIVSDYKQEAQSDYQKMRRGKFLQYHKASNHSKLAIKKLKLIPQEAGKEFLPESLKGKQKFSTTWGRLVWNDVSPTIDTRFDTPSNGKNSHPFLHRAITPREAARLQSFDDDFVFLGNKTSVCKQIGNAVPPLLAFALAQKIQEQKESLVGKNFTIYNDNAFEIVHNLIKTHTSVNHIITDPPYNISNPNNLSTLKTAKRQGVDFGQWDKGFDLLSWISDFAQILDKNGSFIVFCSYKFISQIHQEFEKNSIITKDILVWQKKNPMPRNTNRRYVQDMEFAIWGVKNGAKWTFNKQRGNKYERAFFTSAVVSGKEKLAHPTQKSLKVMQEILKIHTNKQDLILDPFMGSGTTGHACLELDRKFIGVELDKTYYKIAKQRLTNTEQNKT